MPRSPRHLRVFLASPGDLGPERQRTRDVVEAINRQTGRHLGWHIDLLGWEDTLPGVGRPQGLINEDVDTCDLFLGILHMRWGSPSGQFASGFEEEFERAIARWRKTDAPEIWLFFKRVDPAYLTDPGPQLQRVINFRETQTARGELFYKEVETTDDWAGKLFEYLGGYLAKLHATRETAASSGERNPQTSASESPRSIDDRETAGAAVDAATRQLLATLVRVHEVLQDPDQDILASLEKEQITRLHLGATTWMTAALTYDLPSVHPLNAIYGARRSIDPTSLEQQVIFEACLADNTQTIPGWYWVRGLDARTQERNAYQIAFRGRTWDGRAGTLELLAQMKLPPQKDMDLSVGIQQALNETAPPGARSTLLSWVGSVGDRKMIREFKQLFEGRPELPELENAELRVLARQDRRAAFRALLRHTTPSQDLIDAVALSRVQLDRELGRRGLRHPSETVRILTLERMSASGTLYKSDVVELLDDPVTAVRRAAVRVALKKEWSFEIGTLQNAAAVPANEVIPSDERRDLDREILLSSPPDRVEPLIRWYTLTGPLAYEVVATADFRRLEPFIRDDLEDGFSRIRAESRRRIEAALGAGAHPIFEAWAAGEGRLRDEFSAGAIRALIVHGDEADAPLVRRFLTSDDSQARLAAIHFLEEFGAGEDVPRLLTMLDVDSTRHEAARVALSLADDLMEVANAIMASEQPSVTALALQALEDEGQSASPARRLLDSKVPSIRRLGCGFLASALSRSDVEEILDDHMSRRGYYYNVVVWLDRLLYSKGRLRTFFNEQARQPTWAA